MYFLPYREAVAPMGGGGVELVSFQIQLGGSWVGISDLGGSRPGQVDNSRGTKA